MGAWGKLVVLGALLAALTLSVKASPPEGFLGAEVQGQVGVYQASFPDLSKLQKGDVVEVLREGKALGEATVMGAPDRWGIWVSLRGDFPVRRGDRLRFVRRPARSGPAAAASTGSAPAPAWMTSEGPPPVPATGDWRSSIPLPAAAGQEGVENPGYCWLCSQSSPRRVYLRGVSMDICPRCFTVPIFSPHLADTLYKRIQECLEREWGFWVRPSPNLDFVALEGSLLGTFDGWKMEVRSEERLLSLMGTIAHEYAHAWHNKQNPRLRSRVILEGFATWVEFHFLRLLGQPAEAERMLGEVPATPYLSGFRVMQQVERRYGFNAVFRAVENYED